MAVSLNPITRQKLDQFDRRRRRLVLTRGICSGLASFVLLMTLVATADWLWVLPGPARWTMSLAAYLGTALVIWLTCVRLLVHIPSRQELARFVETAQPELREQLLSAIELCADDPGILHDSPVFRQLLQDRVGRQMESVEVSSLLPLRLLARWMAASAAIAALFLLLLVLPGFPLRQLMTRAILPGANLDRVSRVQVTILQPTPHSLTLPCDETVAVIVEVAGRDVDEAALETRSPSGEVVRQAMRVHGLRQFSANIAVQEETIDYRILAGDAVTRYYTIRSRRRPHMVACQKTYHPPEYARLPARTVTETHGDLVALEGTRAEVVFELDQPVGQAELRLERTESDEVETLPLSPVGPLHYRAELPVAEPAVYRVHLVAEETGFDNPFSPRYEIRPEPDLAPRVGLTDMEETSLLLPPNDILSLAAIAEDDLPLVSLSQQVSVNGAEWDTVPLPIEEKPRVTHWWQWDMLDLGLKSGDQVMTRLVATDRKGNRGESIPLQIVVSSPDFDPERHAVMELKAKLYDRLAELAESVATHAEAARAAVARRREDPAPAGTAAADRALLLELAHKIREAVDSAAAAAMEILPQMPPGVDAEEIELVGRLLARVECDDMRLPASLLDLPRDPEDPVAMDDDLKAVDAAFQRSADNCRQLHEHFRHLLAHHILAAAAADLDAVRQYQSGILDSGVTDSWERLVRQEAVVASQLRDAEHLIRQSAARLPAKMEERTVQSLDWIGQWRARLDEAMESEDQLDRLRETAKQLAEELPGQQHIATLEGNLPDMLREARRQLDKRSGSLAEPLRHLAESALLLKTSTASLGETDDSVESRKLQTTISRASAALQRHEGDGLARLSQRRTATQARTDGDTQYASDAGLTRRALLSLLKQVSREPAEGSDTAEILGQIASAYQILEAGHGAVQLDKALADLVARERWESQQICARLDHPRRWDAIHDGCELVANAMGEAKYPPEIAGRINQLRWSQAAGEAGSKIGSRRWRHDDRVAAAYELAQMKTELESSLDTVKPIMEEARALIARYAPTTAQMARQAAEELRQLETETEATADQLADAEPQAAAEAMDRVEDRQDQANRQLDDLLDALAEDAASQDLLTEEGRKRARDADDSSRMIEPPAAQMNRAMEQAAAARQSDEQARQLSQAADRQEQTADVLDKIAEHYQRLAGGGDVTETRQALRQAEQDMGIARQMDQQYTTADELAEMAAKSPQELMQELEAELARNQTMQEALSEITEDAVAQARNSLKHSAERENEMERFVESSDPGFRGHKQALADELRELGRAASDLANRQAYQAESLAGSGKDPQAREQSGEGKAQLERLVAKARDAREEMAVDDLVQLARQTADEADEAARKFRQAEQSTARSKDEKIHENDSRRSEDRRRFEEQQRQFHTQMLNDAKNRLGERSRNIGRIEQQAKRAEGELNRARQEETRRQEALNRDPEKESARRSLREAQQRRQQEEQELAAVQRALERTRQRRAAAEKQVAELEQEEDVPLTAPNPAAELANRYARQAAETAEQVANRARQLAEKPAWADELAPRQETLEGSRKQQDEIGVDVHEAAEDVARAGRHEARLEKAELAQTLNKKARDIEAVAQGEVARSEEQLQEAAEAADPQKAPPQDNRQTLEAHASIGTAEEAISAQVEALDTVLNPPESASQTAAPAGTGETPSEGEPAGQQATPEQAARAQMLARTLDELDRAISGSQSAEAEPGGPPTPPSTLAGAVQAQSSRLAQARMQARRGPQTRQGEPSTESPQDAALVDQGGSDAALQRVMRTGDDWGQLRSQSADDTIGSSRDGVSAEYRQQVETYFRVIAERARKKE